MKKTRIRIFSLLLTVTVLAGLLCPFAGAVEYKGVEPITVDATASLLIDMSTDQILHESNAEERRYPASITKVMTGLLTLEAISRGELTMDTVVTVSSDALTDITDDSSTANLMAGEEVTVHDLLYCLLVVSANEAANILAMTVSGDVPTFVDLMNRRAEELGMKNTHFANPHGLHHPDHYTTAYDIYLMCKEAMTHAPFREIVSTGQYTTAATNLSGPRTLYNTNALLARFKYAGYVYSGTIGIKTGSTPEAGYCLAAAVKKNGVTLVSVVLGCTNPENGTKVDRRQFAESRRLLDWGFTNFTSATLLNADTYLEEVPVSNSFEASHVVVRPVESVKQLIPGAFDPNKV
ncbi:MAG: D-alanyl-D-alanine carboxypeptidase, partial [Ruminiclostridium sp.]|nr:D-alanyl-D-alanine carboxypeptidase [Ruminiclostridium sp.]